MSRRTALCVLGAALLSAPGARAQDAVGSADEAKGPDPKAAGHEQKLKFRESWLILDNAVTTQTLGVGSDYQSANPTYEASLSFRPRYYLYEREPHELFVSGRVDLVREFTNSDVTTRRGETTLADTTLFLADKWNLVGRDTWLLTQAPALTFPTSKFSIDNGTLLGLGARVWLNQTLKVVGDGWPVFRRFNLGVIASYNHTFTRATTPTNPELRRVRLEPDGRTYPGDQLTGSAFAEHELRLGALVVAEITEKVQLWVDAAYRPSWNYGFGPVDVCTQTGCAPAQQSTDPTRYLVTTSFAANLYYDLVPELTIGVGYDNVAEQPGPDGQRRSIFYSPGAQFHLVFWAHLDAIYQSLSGRAPRLEAGL